MSDDLAASTAAALTQVGRRPLPAVLCAKFTIPLITSPTSHPRTPISHYVDAPPKRRVGRPTRSETVLLSDKCGHISADPPSCCPVRPAINQKDTCTCAAGRAFPISLAACLTPIFLRAVLLFDCSPHSSGCPSSRRSGSRVSGTTTSSTHPVCMPHRSLSLTDRMAPHMGATSATRSELLRSSKPDRTLHRTAPPPAHTLQTLLAHRLVAH